MGKRLREMVMRVALLLLVAAFCGCQAQNEASLDSSGARVLPIDDTMDVDWKGTQLGESHPHATGGSATVNTHMPAGNENTAPVTGTGTAPAESNHMTTGTGGPPTITASSRLPDVAVPANVAVHYPTTTNQNAVTQVAKDSAAVDEMAKIAKEAGAMSPVELETLSKHNQAVAGTDQPVATHVTPTEPVATHMTPTQPVVTHIAATEPVVTHIATTKPVVTHITPQQEVLKKECRAQADCAQDTGCQWSGMFSCVSKAAAAALTIASELIGKTAKNLDPGPMVTLATETSSAVNTHTSVTSPVDTHMKTPEELKTDFDSQTAKTAITGHATYVKTYQDQHPATPVTETADATKWIASKPAQAASGGVASMYPATTGVTGAGGSDMSTVKSQIAAVNTHTTTQSTAPVTAAVTPAAVNTHTTTQSAAPVTAGATSAAVDTHTTTQSASPVTTGNPKVDSLYPITTDAGPASNTASNTTTITKKSYTDQYNDEKKSGAANYAVASTYTGGVQYPAGTTATSASTKTQSDLIHEAVQTEINQDKALVVNSAASIDAGPGSSAGSSAGSGSSTSAGSSAPPTTAPVTASAGSTNE